MKISTNGIPLLLLALTICLPALTATKIHTTMELGEGWGRLGWQRWSFGEPKLAAFEFLLAMLLLSLAFALPPRLSKACLKRLRCHPVIVLLTLFLAYAACSRTWVLVPANHAQEIRQYTLLYALFIVLAAWSQTDPRVREVLRWTLALGLTPVVGVGLIQLAGGLSSLPSIDPGYGVEHASLFGYKNPMALAILLHIFLLLKECHLAFQSRGVWRCVFLCLVVAAHLIHLATLQSRTSYVAFLTGCVVLIGGWFWIALRQQRIRRMKRGPVLGVLVCIFIFALGLISDHKSRQRLTSMVDFLNQPTRFLEADRGIYLQNTISMVKEKPWGVGLGDWKTHYPLHREVEPTFAFDQRVQVQRPHNDHIQILGELGWPGFILWLCLLGAVGKGLLDRFSTEGHVTSLYHLAQLLALVVGMGGDFLLDLPGHKQHLFILFAYFFVDSNSGPQTALQLPGASRWMTPLLLLLAFLSMQWSFHTWTSDQLSQRVHLHHELAIATLPTYRSMHLPADLPNSSLDQIRRQQIAGVNALRKELASSLSRLRVDYKVWLILAQAAAWNGEREEARDLAFRALTMHPFQPSTLQLLSKLNEKDTSESSFFGHLNRSLASETVGFNNRPSRIKAETMENTLEK